jgi:serine/threonine-protein kinase
MADGTKFGRYQLLQKLAVGGMAEIFLAKQHGPGHFERSLVIKRILPHLAQDPKFVEMFLDEASLAAQLNHPNIAQVYDFGAEESSYYIAMELIRGPDLANVIAACRQVAASPPVDVALRIITQVSSALDYAHNAADDHGRSMGLVHRDVSPQNVLVSYDGVVKLVDFGIAKAAGASHKTEAGMVKGKFSYMAPEQLRGDKLDGRCDEYATGLLLYELLTLVQALPGDGPSAIAAALEARIEPILNLRADLPRDLADIVGHSLRANRDDRFNGCRELQEALDGWLISRAISVRPHEISLFLAGLQKNLGAPLSPVTSGAGTPPKMPGVQPEALGTSLPARGPSQSRPATAAKNIGDTAISPSESARAVAQAAATRSQSAAAEAPLTDAEARAVGQRRFPWAVAVVAALVTVSGGAAAWIFMRGGPDTGTDIVRPSTVNPTPNANPLPPIPTPNPIATVTPPPKPPANPTPTAAATPTPTPTPSHIPPASLRHEHHSPGVASASSAHLSVSSEPQTEAFLDGNDLGPTPINDAPVPAGKHTLRLANADLAISHVAHLSLSPGQSHREDIHLRKGKVFFAIKPWANITFAGQPLGQTPMDPHTAYEGTYDVVIENPSLNKIVRQKVTVEAGKPTFLKVDLTRG